MNGIVQEERIGGRDAPQSMEKEREHKWTKKKTKWGRCRFCR